jgi:hypothetical protein
MNIKQLFLASFLMLPLAHTKIEVCNNNQDKEALIAAKASNFTTIKPSNKKNVDLESPIAKPKLILSQKERGREQRLSDLKKVNQHLKKHGHKYVLGYLCVVAILPTVIYGGAIGYQLIVHGCL